MRWPWSKPEPREWPSHSTGSMRMRSNETSNRIDMDFDCTYLEARVEGLRRLESSAGKGIEYNGCPECGAFGHGMDRHK